MLYFCCNSRLQSSPCRIVLFPNPCLRFPTQKISTAVRVRPEHEAARNSTVSPPTASSCVSGRVPTSCLRELICNLSRVIIGVNIATTKLHAYCRGRDKPGKKQGFSRVMTPPAGWVRTVSKCRGSARVGSAQQVSKSHRSGRVGSRVFFFFSNLTGRVGSGQDVFKLRGSGRVGS